MRKLILALAAVALLGFGCASTTPARRAPTARPTPQPQTSAPATTEDALYVSFILNVHDWANPTESAATIARVIDIHEKFAIPVDVYLDDPVVQVYAAKAPDLIERLRSSKEVAVSYHLRAPYPYYSDFDWLGLGSLSATELRSTLYDYETHALDLASGATTDAPGGYQYLKDLMGYAPYTVAGASGGHVARAAEDMYKEMGARVALVHDRETKLGQTQNGLWLRPETLEVKAYERKARYSGKDLMAASIAQLPTTGLRFLNLKWHEDNFYSTGTPWAAVYYEAGDKTKPLSPPFDLSLANERSVSTPKTAPQQEEQWKRYEELVAYVAENSNSMTALNSPMLLDLMPE